MQDRHRRASHPHPPCPLRRLSCRPSRFPIHARGRTAWLPPRATRTSPETPACPPPPRTDALRTGDAIEWTRARGPVCVRVRRTALPCAWPGPRRALSRARGSYRRPCRPKAATPSTDSPRATQPPPLRGPRSRGARQDPVLTPLAIAAGCIIFTTCATVDRRAPLGGDRGRDLKEQPALLSPAGALPSG